MLCTTGFESCHRSERCTCNADSAHKPGVRMHNVHTESGVGEWQYGIGDGGVRVTVRETNSFLTSSHSPSAATLPPSADSSSQTAAAPCLPVFVRSRQHPSIPSKDRTHLEIRQCGNNLPFSPRKIDLLLKPSDRHLDLALLQCELSQRRHCRLTGRIHHEGFAAQLFGCRKVFFPLEQRQSLVHERKWVRGRSACHVWEVLRQRGILNVLCFGEFDRSVEFFYCVLE